MTDIHHLLSSADNYKNAFEEGLISILKNKTAGTFILACANLFQHPELLKKNNALLHEVYEHINNYYQACHSAHKQPDDAVDDVAVMNSLIEIGLANLQNVEYREVISDEAAFLLNYNQLRSFRPARMSKTKNIQIDTAFNSNGFHFDKPFLEKEIFAEGRVQGKQLSLLYNKFPFIDYHALLVIDKAQHLNQYLTKNQLDYIAKLQFSTQQACPEFVMAYNSLGAGASVNHLHFHAYLERSPLPVFSERFIHNDGSLPYPANCLVFNGSDETWQAIQLLHQKNTPYNLLFRNNNIFCLPRKKPGRDFKDLDVASYGWSNMAGLINVNNKEILENIKISQLIGSLESTSKNTGS